MNTKIIIGLILAVAVVVGGLYFFSMQGARVEDTPSMQEGDTQAAAGAYTGSFADLMRRTGDWKCTVDAATAQSVSSGTTYVSNGKVRADFTSTIPSYGTVESHMIADGQYVYTWSSMMPTGIKVLMLEPSATAAASTDTAGQGMDANQSYSYDCMPWAADASLFTPPSDVEFMSFEQKG